MTKEQQQQDLESLQDAIYRDKVLRARAMTPEQRLDEAFVLTGEVFEQMHAGAMIKLGTKDPILGWNEVERGLSRLRAAEEADLYSLKRPVAS